MRFHRFALVLIPVGPLVAAFGGCGITVNEVSGWGGGSMGVSVGSSSSSGVTVTGTGAGATGQLAATCSTTADCGGDLGCLRPGDADPVFGGGAPGGFCTRPCTLDADCAREGGICYGGGSDAGQPGRCTLPCGFGPPLSGVSSLFSPLSAVKCRARDDVRCVPDPSGEGACLPTCGSDAQCPGGRCDPRTAVCVPTPSAGQPMGAACDPSMTTSVCAGLCIGFQTGAAMCSQPCVLGGAGVASPSCGGAEQGLCAFHAATHGAGDTGFCTPSCAAQTDCQNPGFWCFGVSQLTDVLHRGYCFGATACPNGPPDCGASATCTTTPAGPLCLDPAFPLDLDGGAGDAGSADASAPDGGPLDAGPGDGGGAEAGSLDAGDGGDGG